MSSCVLHGDPVWREKNVVFTSRIIPHRRISMEVAKKDLFGEGQWPAEGFPGIVYFTREGGIYRLDHIKIEYHDV